MSADILEYVDQKVRDSASSSTEWSILYADDWAKLRAEIVRLRGEVADARGLVEEANNSLYGSHGYFHSLNGGPYDKHHLANGIEELKTRARAAYIAPAEAKGDASLAKLAYETWASTPPDGESQWPKWIAVVDALRPQPADGGAVAQRSKFIVDRMVSAFLSWRLPQDFRPDNGVAFAAPDNPSFWPSGTNLLNADQTKAMVEHMLGSAIARDRYSTEEEGDAFTDGYFTGADEAQAHPPAAQVQPKTVPCDCGCGRQCCASCGNEIEDPHPAGDALGAVRELPEKWRNRAAREGIVKSANWYATQLEAALQPRGDSQEVGRG